MKLFIFAALIVFTLSQIIVDTDKQTYVTASFGNATVEIRLTGAPRFTVTSKDGTSSRVLFSKLYQIDSSDNLKKKLGGTNVALASMEWTFSDITLSEDKTRLEWNMTGRTNSSPWTLQFVNKISSDKVELKFDTRIRKFADSWAKDAKYLVLAYRITNKDNSETKSRSIVGNKVTFDNGFFAIDEKANQGTKKVQAMLDTDDDNNGVYTTYILYEKFGDELDHDPTLGLETVDNSIIFIIAIVVVGVVGILFTGFIVVGAIVYFIVRHREQQFHAI